MAKRKKKHWTTKNTHIKKIRRSELPVDLRTRKERLYNIIGLIVALAFAALVIIIQALNNHVVGYDHFIGIPTEWVRSLYDLRK